MLLRLSRLSRLGEGRGKGEGKRTAGAALVTGKLFIPRAERKELDTSRHPSLASFSSLPSLKGTQINQLQQHVIRTRSERRPGIACCCCFARRGSRTLKWVGSGGGNRTAAEPPGLVTKEAEEKRMATSSNSSLSGSSVSSGEFTITASLSLAGFTYLLSYSSGPP